MNNMVISLFKGLVHILLTSIIYAFILSLSCSVDAFGTSFAFGTQRVKITHLQNIILSVVASVSLTFAVLFGGFINEFLPVYVTVAASFFILFALGLYKIASSFIQNSTDVKPARPLSLIETVILAVTLSLDGMAAGFGAALIRANPVIILITSFAIGFAAILAGSILGRRVVRKTNMNLAWLSGVLLIAIAFMNLVL